MFNVGDRVRVVAVSGGVLDTDNPNDIDIVGRDSEVIETDGDDSFFGQECRLMIDGYSYWMFDNELELVTDDQAN